MNILIIDDEPLARNELMYLLNQCKGINTIIEAGSIEEALECLLKQSIDLAFIDIQLTNETGLDLADKIGKLPNPPSIVFATAYDDYAIQAFEKNARDYILKPFELSRVMQAVKRVMASKVQRNPKLNKSNDSQENLPIQMGDRIIMVKVNEILAIEVSGGEATIHTKNEPMLSKEPLTAWEKRLTNANFMRVHRSFIIQMDAIQEIQPWFNHTYQVTLKNQLKIPVSRSYIKEFKFRVGI